MPLVINNVNNDNLFNNDFDIICLDYYLNTQVDIIKLLEYFWGIMTFDFLELMSGESMESRGIIVPVYNYFSFLELNHYWIIQKWFS